MNSKFLDRGARLFRHLSVFYIFFAALMLVFVFYQYKFKPKNERELFDRGQDVLNQLAVNFLEKAGNVRAIFADSSSTHESLIHKKDNLEVLDGANPFTIEESPAAETLHVTHPYFDVDKEGSWQIMFPMADRQASHGKANRHIGHHARPPRIVMSLKKFARPLFSVRDDIFETYLLLLDTCHSEASSSKEYPVIYNHDEISASFLINLDTLRSLQKNSDLSGVVTATIAGNQYKTFVQPFHFYDQKVLMVGLVNSDKYADSINATPIALVQFSIIMILLLLIFLPFVKLFFLSPREPINARDVWWVIVSFYLGSSVLVLIAFYLIVGAQLRSDFNSRLYEVSSSIERSLDKDISDAGRQLSYFDSVYRRLTPDETRFLSGSKEKLAGPVAAHLDAVMAPVHWAGCSRIFWLNDKGQTLAKWNPFNFYAPLTDVSNLDFFKLFRSRFPNKNARIVDPSPVMFYCGKSNITEEFQVYFSSRTKTHLLNPRGLRDSVEAYAVSMAGNISCSDHTLVPPGFGFCVIDDKGKVLIHSDSRRNLSENFIDESGEDPNFMASWNLKNGLHLFNFRLYGDEVVCKVVPVQGQAVSLVVYYKKQYLSEHLFRSLKFSFILCVAMLGAVLLSLLLAALVNEKRSSLPFSLHMVEWIRPSNTNSRSYAFNTRYFSGLFVLGLVATIVVIAFNLDAAAMLYMAVLLPFYCLVGYIYSRCAYGESSPQASDKRMLIYPWLFIIGINLIILLSLFGWPRTGNLEQVAIIFIFQVFAFIFLIAYRGILKKNEKVSVPLGALYSQYMRSLGLSVVLIGFFPVIGILIYAWSAERTQMGKERLLCMARKLDERARYFLDEVSPNYKPGVYAHLGGAGFIKNYIYCKGIYVHTPDCIDKDPQPADPDQADSRRLGDELYYFVNEQAIPAPPDINMFPIQNLASDKSWYFFRNEKDGNIGLRFKGTSRENQGYFLLRGPVSRPIINREAAFPFYGVFAYLLLLFGFWWLGKLLLKNVINRLFLLNYSSALKIKTDNEFLNGWLVRLRPSSCYLEGVCIPAVVKPDFFEKEYRAGSANYTREEFIIAMTDAFAPVYDKIWQSLSPEEQFVLYDFSIDRLTNYKNSAILFRLIQKGLLMNRFGTLDLFAPSFRNYVLTRTMFLSSQAASLGGQSGVWNSVKVPVFSIIGVVAIFMLMTQNEVTNRITALMASIAALIPLVMKLFEKGAANGQEGA